MSDAIAGGLIGTLITCALIAFAVGIAEQSAINACEFNSESLSKCEYVRTAMHIVPTEGDK